MRLHYLLWVAAAMTVFFATLIFRGQQDMLFNHARMLGVSSILEDMTPRQLSELDI